MGTTAVACLDGGGEVWCDGIGVMSSAWTLLFDSVCSLAHAWAVGADSVVDGRVLVDFSDLAIRAGESDMQDVRDMTTWHTRRKPRGRSSKGRADAVASLSSWTEGRGRESNGGGECGRALRVVESRHAGISRVADNGTLSCDFDDHECRQWQRYYGVLHFDLTRCTI